MSASGGVAPVPADHRRRERCGSQCSVSRCQLSFRRRRADDDRRVGVVGLERGERLHRLAEALLVGEERAARVEHVGARRRAGTGAARRRARPRSSSGRPVVRARAADVLDRRVVLGAQALEHVGGVRRHLDAERAQVVLERLEQVGVDRQRAAVRLGSAGSARKAGIVSGSQLTSSLRRGSPTLSISDSVGAAPARARPAAAARSAARARRSARRRARAARRRPRR